MQSTWLHVAHCFAIVRVSDHYCGCLESCSRQAAHVVTQEVQSREPHHAHRTLYQDIIHHTQQSYDWFRKPNQHRTKMVVPSIAQVRPGAAVSIVLKKDQPTGRQVQGKVQDVLTSGNHPRGIKVRLADGRIGRVQRMHTAGSETDAVQQADTQTLDRSEHSTSSSRSHRFKSKYSDMRLEDTPAEPPSQYDLSSFIVKEAKPKKNKKGAAMQPVTAPEPEAVAKCPVCDDFEGDEAAVAHHVESHFA